MEKDEQELKTKDECSEKLSELEENKIELVRKLYKIDENYDIDELNTLRGSLVLKNDIENQLKMIKNIKKL